ncbi:hypothetical protein [Vagococcus carniphilus]|uniref:hypothetical protein n=1 Tax=Vagococcus carniphilus TaxID=218144 RepID=UPI002890F088|nr:hypothetical protein [Vagococcus carniphilus]MDT2840923.1 hypothetical protein [Vagococcus carniphilus]
MGKVLRREELEKLAHTVKTKDDKIWVNLYDGRFILRESIDWKKPVIRKTHNIYHQVECVISKEMLVARRDPILDLLEKLDKPKAVKTLL